MTTITLDGLTSLIDNLEEGILFLDRDRKVVTINQAALQMLGERQEAVTARLCPSLFQGTTCARACEQRGHCSLMKPKLKDKKTQDITIKRADDTLASLRMWAMALPENEPLARCAVILRDITRERNLEHEASERLRLGGLLGHSRAMQELFQNILRAASSEATVLITGESGTGKELVARALHENSSRAKGPYIRVHCAAFVETLLESELFGHARGAFTGATSARAGRFEAADGGTLLLDEIGEISASIQVKLLRVLQEREVERLGENLPRKVDVRILAATNRDLEAMVQAGQFRADLYYRLRVLPLHVPPLRERDGDIVLLANQLLSSLTQRYKRGDLRLAPETIDAMEAYHWPGNVRQLANTLEYAVVQSDGDTILPRHLPAEIRVDTQSRSGKQNIFFEAPATTPLTRYYRAPVTPNGDEKETIKQALNEAGGNRAAAARLLGMSRTTLWKRLKELGL